MTSAPPIPASLLVCSFPRKRTTGRHAGGRVRQGRTGQGRAGRGGERRLSSTCHPISLPGPPADWSPSRRAGTAHHAFMTRPTTAVQGRPCPSCCSPETFFHDHNQTQPRHHRHPPECSRDGQPAISARGFGFLWFSAGQAGGSWSGSVQERIGYFHPASHAVIAMVTVVAL